MTPAERITAAEEYLAERTASFEQRCKRYDAALTAMHDIGLTDSHVVFDVGAGDGHFGVRLHTWGAEGLPQDFGVMALYVPVDALVDGTDLELWVPPRNADWFVCLEVLEHLEHPARLIQEMQWHATKGVIVSTPNPETTDVLAMDSTHRTPITQDFLRAAGFSVTVESFFGNANDSLLGVHTVP